MRTVLMLCAVALPLLFGGTACGHETHRNGVIVLAKSPDEGSGYLGVSIQDMTRRLAKSMDVKTTEGALVNDVVEDSPAEEAGIKKENIIVEVDGKKIADADELRETIKAIKPGTKVTVVVMRKDEKKSLTATIDRQPRRRSYSYTVPSIPRVPRVPHHPMDIRVFRNSMILGMQLSELNPQLGKYFDAPKGKGVLVMEVEEDSKAEKAGFMAGDVITKVGKESVEDVRDVESALHDFKKGDKAEFEIIRKGAKKTLTVEVPDRNRRSYWGSGDNFYEFNFNPDDPDIDIELEGHSPLKERLRELQLELRDLGKEVQTKARKFQQELKARLTTVMS